MTNFGEETQGSTKKTALAVLIALVAVAAAGWTHREEFVMFVEKAIHNIGNGIHEKPVNQSWDTVQVVERVDEAEQNPRLDDEQLRDLAKFWSKVNMSNDNENNAEPVAQEEPVTKEEPILYTDVSVAAYHNHNKDGPSQKEAMLSYLKFDDGYTTCIKLQDLKSDPNLATSLELKHSKFMHLQRIANVTERWIVRVPETDEPVHVEERFYSELAPTCRLLTITQEEYNGRANEVLKRALQSSEEAFTVEWQNQASEFRTMVCLARLVDEFLRKISDPTRRAAMESLKQTWASVARTARARAEQEPLAPLPAGWRELRNEKSSWHAYYMNERTGHTSWVRPLDNKNRNEIAAPSSSNTDKPLKRASLIARNKPCDLEMSRWMLGN